MLALFDFVVPVWTLCQSLYQLLWQGDGKHCVAYHQLSESVLEPWVDSALLEAYGLRMGKESYPKGTLRAKYETKIQGLLLFPLFYLTSHNL